MINLKSIDLLFLAYNCRFKYIVLLLLMYNNLIAPLFRIYVYTCCFLEKCLEFSV